VLHHGGNPVFVCLLQSAVQSLIWVTPADNPKVENFTTTDGFFDHRLIEHFRDLEDSSFNRALQFAAGDPPL
jgi:hypothetical protein